MVKKIFDTQNETSLNQKFRAKRFEFFMSLFNKVQSPNPIRIHDIGGTENYWERMKFLETHPDVQITLLNLKAVETKYPNLKGVKGDACNLAEYKDNEFDIVFSNSVIEHLFTRENQQKMANEARRVGKNYYVQTPNYWFPLEPHWIFPFFQYFPFSLKVYLTMNFNLGNFEKMDRQSATNIVKEIKLLTEKEMKSLFPDGKVYREILAGLTKSVAMYKFPGD